LSIYPNYNELVF
jgi:Inositol 1,4,5-trisphosphate/ryanodine receptor